jgi:hypothetical protein
MRSRASISPATLIALVALFFALGGSAFALSQALQPQPRCAQGAIRGIATVTGDPAHGIANMPETFTANRNFFARRFNCTGGGIQVRRVNTGLYDVRFLGNPAPTGLATAIAEDGSSAAVNRLPDGTWRVSTRGSTTNGNQAVLRDVSFSIFLL